MTIRDYIKSRGRLLRVLTFGWFVLPVALIFIFPERAKTSGIMWLAVGYVVMAAIRYAIAWQTSCPRCGKSLWSVTMRATSPLSKIITCSCPKCGVTLDESMDRK
jgi:ribosomal protein S27AE